MHVLLFSNRDEVKEAVLAAYLVIRSSIMGFQVNLAENYVIFSCVAMHLFYIPLTKFFVLQIKVVF